MVHLIRQLQSIPKNFPGCVLTIGNFDGVHCGHQILIQRLLEKARELQLPAVLMTFEPYPEEFFSRRETPPRLTTLREKITLLSQLGLDYVICIKFDKAFSEMTAENFIEEIVVNRLKTKYLVLGDDFHFGYKRIGNFQLIQKMAPQNNFCAESLPTFKHSQDRVSSSRIRLLLQQSDLISAEKLLGRRYGILGKVIHGSKFGRVLGFPTANILPHRKTVPIEGIFIVEVYIDQVLYPGVADLGNRPTLDGSGRTILEVHLLDFNQDIYGKTIYVEFIKKLRDEEKYDTVELLRLKIAEDVENAKLYFHNHPPNPCITK